MKEYLDRFKKLSRNEQLIVLGIAAVVLFLLRHILVLIIGLAVAAWVVWVLLINQGLIIASFNSLFCSFGFCI